MSLALPNRRCLVIEDDEVSRLIVAHVLEREGWQVTACGAAEEARTATVERVPDLLLLDLGLPGVDGLTFCRELRADPRWRDVVILVCTGRADAADLSRVLDAGADDYLTKPVDTSMLRVRLRVAAARVDRARQRQDLEREASVFKFNAESSQDAVYWLDPAQNFRFVWVNQACSRHFLRSRDELLHLRLDDCDPTFGPEEAGRFRDRLRRDGSCILETLHLRGDGTVIPVEMSANRFHDGHRELVTGFLRDISARRSAEATLARAALLLSRLRDAVFCAELDGTVTFWNEGAEQLFGWTAAEMIGRPLESRFPADAAVDARALFARVAAGEEWNGEWLEYRKDGARVWTDSSIARFVDGEGRPAGILGIAHDVSVRKQAERERAELERKLQETQKLESLGVLTGGIAHDFNNLLTGILGNASLARLELPPDSSPAAFVVQIEEAAMRAAELCQQMLAYSGKGRFIVQPISLRRLVEETARLLHLSINKKARLVLELDSALPAVHGDITQLRQVVMNLVINASEALGPREGEIVVSARPVRLSRARLALMHGGDAAGEGEFVELAVRDNGCGMSPATLERIFEPFFTTKFTGRGLGLSAVLGIVRGHHGALAVSSVPGHGTTFTIVLPAGPQAAVEPSAGAGTQAWQGAGTVLIADDEAPVREVLEHMLARLGFTVEIAVDGREAVTRFRAQADRYAAVLLDLSMPRCDGGEALREIRAVRADAVVIVMTGHGCTEVDSRLGGETPNEIVQKPFTAATIATALRQALGPRGVAVRPHA